MKAMQVREVGRLELVELDIPEPGPNQVRVRVEACGVCHSDALTVNRAFPTIQLPRIPGHEVAGVVDAVGPGVEQWRSGQRVGMGWHGGHCGRCTPCRRGDFVLCRNQQICGVTVDGGYAQYMIARAEGLVAIPDTLAPAEAGPLLCAGITTFNSLRNAGARPPDRVAVQGLGGLGHLAVQFSARMGFETIAIARGADKAPFARQLGAHRYIDSSAEDPGAALQKLGGARIILSTITDAKSMAAVASGLGINGRLIIIGAVAEPLQVNALPMIMNRQDLQGWPSGAPMDSEDTLLFSALTGVCAMTEVLPLEQAGQAYEKMLSGRARFRMVITP